MAESEQPLRKDLEPAEIRRIREGLGLSQVEAGELLGGGPRAFTKYESGTIRPAASVVKLLQLLDADPRALATLTGRKVAPIDHDGAKPLEVTSAHIAALTDRKLANLARRLLAAEAQNGDLPMDGIHVAASITVADGGEDARIEWSGGAEYTSFLPNRLTQFQLKATEISPAEAGAEVLASDGIIKSMVRDVLGAGGAYVVLCSRPYTSEKIKTRVARIIKTLTEKGMAVDDRKIQFRDASQIAQWVNARPPVAAWVLEQTQPGMVGPFRDWVHWAGRYEHESSPWVPDLRLAPLRDRLRERAAFPRTVTRIVGLSGVGKSRLTLEALGPTEDEEARAAPALSSIVLYVVESDAGSHAIKAAVQSLADASARAIIVVDRCPMETHQDLAAMVKRSGSRLSLVTIDHEIPAGPLTDEFLIINRADETVIDSLLKYVAENLPTEDHRRLVRFSDGFPQLTHLLGQAWLKDASIAAASDEDLVDRIVFGRKPFDRSLLQDAAMLLSVFGLLGVRESLTDLETIAPLTRGRTADDLRAALDNLTVRGVVQRRGRLLTLQPRPIALALADRQWRQWSPAKWDDVLAGTVPDHLRKRAARQLAYLNDRPVSTEVARHVCRPNGPLSSLIDLGRGENADILSSLTEIDADIVLAAIERMLSPLSESETKAIGGNLRRGLVRALEKICFIAATFEQGAALLLKLAVAENETWGNNATGQFKALFPAFLADTEADGDARLRLLDDLVDENLPQKMPIVVDALLEGATTSGFSRSIGAEVHGSRPALEPWHPKLWKDAWHYITECVDRLAKLSKRTDDIGARARKGLGHHLRALVSRGLIDRVENWVTEVSAVHPYWPEALGSLGHVLQYDKDKKELESGVENRVRKLIAALTPSDLKSRVQFIVTEMPWDFPGDASLKFAERQERQTKAVEEIVDALLVEPSSLLGLLPQLNVGQHRMVYAFGRALAIQASKPLEWFDPIKSAVLSAREESRNFGLLVGYLSGLKNRHPQVIEKFKQEAVKSEVFARVVVMACAAIGIRDDDITLVSSGLASGLIPPQELSHWTMGRALDDLPPPVVAPLVDQMLMMDAEAYLVALDLLGMYVFSRIDQLEHFRPQLKLAAALAGRREKKGGSQMGAHHFQELMGWLLAKGWDDEDARSVALSLAKHMANDPDGDQGDLLAPLLPSMLSKFGPIVWPVLSQVMSSPDRISAWKMEHALGGGISFDEDKAPSILSLSEDILFAWCHAQPEVGPAFVAATVPMLSKQDSEEAEQSFHPIVQRLLAEFGDNDAVLKKLLQNMYTFGWSGSLTTYYALYKAPLRTLETHPIGAVRRWAKKTLSGLERQIEDARNEDEEDKAQWE